MYCGDVNSKTFQFLVSFSIHNRYIIILLLGSGFFITQVIWLLRGYGIQSKEFINLQNDTLLELAKSLKDPVQASKSLMNYQGNGIFKQVLDSGIDLTQEPFHRMQLLSLYKFHVKEVN